MCKDDKNYVPPDSIVWWRFLHKFGTSAKYTSPASLSTIAITESHTDLYCHGSAYGSLQKFTPKLFRTCMQDGSFTAQVKDNAQQTHDLKIFETTKWKRRNKGGRM